MEGKEYNNNHDFYTNVIKGNKLHTLYNEVKDYRKRDCFQQIIEYIKGNYDGRNHSSRNKLSV